MIKKLKFGTGGVPLSAKSRDVLDGIKRIHELGLDLLEIEFVYGVRMNEEKARKAGELAKELGVTLTIHGPYYINLNSPEPEKRKASRERILDSCRIGEILGAKSVTFHAAFNLGQPADLVFDRVTNEMLMIEEVLEKEEIENIMLAPELTGKPTQFGSVEELIALTKCLTRTTLCVDFAHHYARYAGKNNGYEDFLDILKIIEHGLGKQKIDHLHMHYSGINYTAKGERKHEVLAETDFNWKKMLKAIKDFEIGGYLVCESPNLEEDALIAKDYYESI